VVFVVREGGHHTPATVAHFSAGKEATTAKTGTRLVGAAFWTNAFKWFPPEATLFGAVDLQAFGSLKLEDEATQVMLRLALPAKVRARFTPENLGRLRLDGVTLAYYDDARLEKSRAILGLHGLALDGHKRILDFLRDVVPGIDEVERQTPGSSGKTIRVSSPELPFALGISDDQRFFLARSLRNNSQSEQLKVLAGVRGFADDGDQPLSLVSGYQPPWMSTALAKVPRDACALLLGEIPLEWRKELTEVLHLHACPRTFVAQMKRQGPGVVLSLALHVDRAGAEKILCSDLEQWRREALEALTARYPKLLWEPGALRQLEQTLKTMRWGAKAGSGVVRTEIQLPGTTWKSLGKLLKRVYQP
jgi:hypothetical protein